MILLLLVLVVLNKSGSSKAPIQMGARLVSASATNILEDKAKERQSILVLPLGSPSSSEQQTLEEANASILLPEEEYNIKRHLQVDDNVSPSIVEVLDLGIDIPAMDESSDVTDETYQNEGIVGSNGVTVTIENLSSNQSIQFLGLEILLRESNIPMIIQIYARDGADMVNPLEQSSTEWTLLEEKKDVTLTSDRTFQFASLPLTVNPYTIKANSALTLFVFVEQAQSIMVSTKKSKQIAKEHTDGWMTIKSGTAVRQVEDSPNSGWASEPYSAFLGSIFCAPYVESSITSDGASDTSTTSIISPYELDTMAVWKAGDVPTRTYGIVFDVYSSTGCNITSMDIHTPMTTYMVVEVYSMVVTGTGDEDDGSWTLRSKAGIVGLGQTELTPIPLEQFRTLTLLPFTKASFFVTTTQIEIANILTKNFVGSAVEGVDIINNSIEQDDSKPMQPTSLDVFVGQTIVRYPIMDIDTNGKYVFGIGADDVGSKAVFSGTVHYEPGIPLETQTPTSSPTLAPTSNLNPELISQLKLSIAGISRRTLVRQLQQSGGVMDNDAIRQYFEDIGRTFVNGMVNSNNASPPIDVRKFVVSPEITDGDLEEEQQRKLWERFLQQGDEEEADSNVEGDLSLNVYTTILGDYSPPPVVDFSSLTEDAFDVDGDTFLRDLKSDPPPEVGKTFDDAQSIRAEQVTFPKPPNLYDDIKMDQDNDETPETKQFNFLIWVYIGSGCAVGILCCTVTVCMLRRNRNEKLRKNKLKKRMDQGMKKSGDDPRQQYGNIVGVGAGNQAYHDGNSGGDPSFLRDKEQYDHEQQQQMMYDDYNNNHGGTNGYSKTSMVSSVNFSYHRQNNGGYDYVHNPPPSSQEDDHHSSTYVGHRNDGTMSTSRRSSHTSSAGASDGRRPLRRSSIGSVGSRSQVSTGHRRLSMNGANTNSRYVEVPIEEPIVDPNVIPTTSYYGDMEDPNQGHIRYAGDGSVVSRRGSQSGSIEDVQSNMMIRRSNSVDMGNSRDNIANTQPTAVRRASLQEMNHYANPESNEQRFWSLSGRHMLSGSGRHVWDAVTGEPLHTSDDDHGISSSDEYYNEQRHHHGDDAQMMNAQYYSDIDRTPQRRGSAIMQADDEYR